MAVSSHDIVQSYRQIYRHALHAVRYAVPARYTVREELRQAYRTALVSSFNAQKIDNTVEFLASAAEETGTAHKVLKTLIHVWWWQRENPTHHQYAISTREQAVRKNVFQHFNVTVKMLNESMGLCLPDRDILYVRQGNVSRQTVFGA